MTAEELDIDAPLGSLEVPSEGGFTFEPTVDLAPDFFVPDDSVPPAGVVLGKPMI